MKPGSCEGVVAADGALPPGPVLPMLPISLLGDPAQPSLDAVVCMAAAGSDMELSIGGSSSIGIAAPIGGSSSIDPGGIMSSSAQVGGAAAIAAASTMVRVSQRHIDKTEFVFIVIRHVAAGSKL